MKEIYWIGTSLADTRAFPAEARQEAGYQLDKVQRGFNPTDWKPMNTIGKGAREIRIRQDNGQFRIIYLAVSGNRVYVLHGFQKKTQRTSQKDINLARARLKEVAR